MKTIMINNHQFIVEYHRDEYADAPWDWCDDNLPVRVSNKPHRADCSDKRPGEIPLNRAGRNEYQFYVDWQAGLKLAKRDGWNTLEGEGYFVAAQQNLDYLRAYVNEDWHYVIVKITSVVTGESDSLGMVETWKDYHREAAQEMAQALYKQIKVQNRFADAMECGL